MSGSEESRYSGGNHQGQANSAPYPTSRLQAPISLVNIAQELELASQSVSSHAGARLQVILDQMRALQAEAQEILQKAKADLDLHQAACNFKRTVGRVYHLYRRIDNSLYFSMLSPEDHGGAPPHEYVNSYRLEPDQSWTPQAETARVDAARIELERAFTRRLLPPT
ncbi:MAG: DUF2452 domain-containing protein [Polyangiaceae bacterium]|nr:DUF2452 domain-containing protein [Polyangiaceae bacterium]